MEFMSIEFAVNKGSETTNLQESNMARYLFIITLLLISSNVFAQTMSVEEYEPKSTLVVTENKPTRAKYPFIDVHTHYDANMSRDRLDALVKELDAINLHTAVNLSGGTGDKLLSGVKNMKGNYPKRFLLFANLSYDDVNDSDYGKKAAARLEQDVRNGAQGLKIFKQHGL